MKVEATGFPAKLTIIKVVGTPSGVSDLIWGFDRSDVAGSPNFFLQDNGDDNDGYKDRITIDYPIAAGGAAVSVSIKELALGFGWSINDIGCTDVDGGLGFNANSTPQTGNYVSGDTAVANLQEAEFVTCTFTNGNQNATAAPATVGGRVVNSLGRGLSGVTMTLTDLHTGEAVTTLTNSFGYYSFANVNTDSFYSLTASSKRYTFMNETQYFTLTGDNLDLNFESR
jgi:hypothetical protein